MRFWGVIKGDTDRKKGITPLRVYDSFRGATEFIVYLRKLLVIEFQNKITNIKKKNQRNL